MTEMRSIFFPPATIGIIGGGQLGQMMALSAKAMGYHVGVLDPTPDAPAAQVSDFQITAAYDDQKALTKLAEKSDLLTYEFENVDQTALAAVAKATGTAVPQGVALLDITSNRLNEKNFLRDHGLPTTAFAAVASPAELRKAVEEIGFPGILKTISGGYDGHGQWDMNSQQDVDQLIEKWPDKLTAILEKRVNFVKEISIMVTRDGQDQVKLWPVTENLHQHHILHFSLAPADIKPEVRQSIREKVTHLAQELHLYGVLGVEMFLTADDRVIINELAPRPHNSGHLTIEACNVSQFEGHIRSICGLPIADPILQSPAAMRNLLGNDLLAARQDLLKHPEWHFHDYGKAEVRPGRKMGHITVVGSDAIKELKGWRP
ncbi:Phosphoribosylaminoimidazole carboxylase ATPase subunit [Oenococcus kitaharae DSM 17330]|uniref:N5-carboxyaminoimidazole ribonucleotide synthase n=2 Tax=Oenococcus kitaharae TaxID=336988 RepID=G9WH05_9LACO|nr:Phosphoribosylaminoimidazole carboxylase ATPase subunit [Oenococcus kitaharae DSM 17330]